MRARTWCCVIIALAAAVPVAGQESDLRTLAEAAVGGRLLVGEIPAHLPVAEIIPDDVRVVGTVDRGRGAMIVLKVPGDRESAERLLTDAFRARGWMPPEGVGMDTGPGFVSSRGTLPGNLLCGMDAFVMVRTVEGSGDATLLHLTVQPREGDPPCDSASRPRGRIDSPVPVLVAPTGVEVRGRGMSSSDDEFEARGTLRTDLSVSEIAAQYAEQVEQQGWEPVTVREDDVVALRTWTNTDPDAGRLHGMLLVVAPPGVGGRVASFRVTPLTGSMR